MLWNRNDLSRFRFLLSKIFVPAPFPVPAPIPVPDPDLAQISTTKNLYRYKKRLTFVLHFILDAGPNSVAGTRNRNAFPVPPRQVAVPVLAPVQQHCLFAFNSVLLRCLLLKFFDYNNMA